MKKIIFITHETSRTGAPIVLLLFLRWLKKKCPSIEVTVLDLKEGGIKKEFQEVSDFYFSLDSLHIPPNTFFQEFRKRISKKMGNYYTPTPPFETLINSLSKKKFDVIYGNTVLSLKVANKIKRNSPSSKLILHVHELNTIIKHYVPNFRNELSLIDLFIAASEMTKSELIELHQVPEDKVKTIYEFSELPKKQIKSQKKSFVVGGAGTVHWRKGSDLFIQVANYLNTHFNDLEVNFEWIGGVNAKEQAVIEGDLKKGGLEKIVFFKGEKEDPIPFFRKFDVFLLCSREDPFPLVAVEIGSLGIPILCFEGATGTQEILIKGGGIVVPYLNIQKMAEEVVKYYWDRNRLEKEGKEAELLFSRFTAEEMCPVVFDAIKNV